MKGETPQEFLEGLYYGMEQVFIYKGRTRCAQGWREEDGRMMMKLEQWEPMVDDYLLWDFRAPTPEECLKDFLAAPVFDGRTFWEAETEFDVIFA